MTITSDVLEAEGLGNGAAFDFSFAPLKIFRIAEGANAGKHTLRVVFVAANGDITPLEEGVGADKYSLVGTFDGVTARTGSIKYPQDESTPIPTGSKVVMVVAVPLMQQNGIPNQGGWFPKTQEGMFDRLTLIDQQLQEQVDRAVKVPLGSSTDPDELIATLTADAAAAVDAKIAAEAAQELSEDWASKTDGQVASTDYSSKAYAVGGTGTETNNSKYYSEQAALSAASVNLPSITATDTGSLVQVNAAGTGYDKLAPGTSGKFLMSNGADAALSYENIPLDVPIGTSIDFCGTDLQDNFIATDGAAISRTTYAALFTAIGTTWGVGDGSTTFNVPLFERRTTVGSGGSGTGTLGNAVGNVGGAETFTQTTSTMPSHNHPGSTVASVLGTGINNGNSNLGNVATYLQAGSIASQGSGTAHTIMQPSAVVYKQIRYR
jgi:microcystin-dependent protein